MTQHIAVDHLTFSHMILALPRRMSRMELLLSCTFASMFSRLNGQLHVDIVQVKYKA